MSFVLQIATVHFQWVTSRRGGSVQQACNKDSRDWAKQREKLAHLSHHILRFINGE